MDPQASDDFFELAQEAYAEAIAFDRSAVPPALMVAATHLIAGGSIDDSYTAEEYVRDFMGRV